MKNLSIALFLALFFCSFFSYSQYPNIQWKNLLGNNSIDNTAKNIIKTNTDGYIFSAKVKGNDGDVVNSRGFFDAWIVKFGGVGNVETKKCYGGSQFDEVYRIKNTTDGGYVFIGNSNSTDGDVVVNNNATGAWICKTNSSGDIIWSKAYGGNGIDVFEDVVQTSDGYLAVGYTTSTTGEFSGNHSNSGDLYIVKLDQNGNQQWMKLYGGTNYEDSFRVYQTTDGFLIAGKTGSNNGDLNGPSDFVRTWLLKINNVGILQWQKAFMTTYSEYIINFTKLSNGNFVLMSNSYQTTNQNDSDIWIRLIDNNGNIISEKIFGGNQSEFGGDFIETSDGGYLLMTNTYSNSGLFLDNHGGSDIWLAKLNQAFEIQWHKCLGGSQYEFGKSIIEGHDKGYIFVGETNSVDGDINFQHPVSNIWTVKLNPETCPLNLTISNPISTSIVKYEVGINITATNKIISNANVKYDAGKSIELKSGFEVAAGNVFQAYIDGCGNY
jgi:hypothetical protein